MRLEDLGFELPDRLIAQRPADRREDARLLVVDRARGRSRTRASPTSALAARR
jgi:S-adenosylmethionine:tRNA ribosyltransferase-isomerase